jgi:LDH2 family malate/lactate/ureidoglycolate dehydrogenase
LNIAPQVFRTADTDALGDFCVAAFRAAGADEASSKAVRASLLHASVHGVDSHGVRLLPHYIKALQGGRLNANPVIRFNQTRPGTGMLDGDHAQGALPTYRAAQAAVTLAGETGIGAVGIHNSSHFGPAGAYALEIAEAGFIGIVFGNSDAFVRLHEGATRFHGTNPIAMATPVGDEDPWLLDMATSAIPFNRVRLFAATGQTLPSGVASDGRGYETRDATLAQMLAPFGANYGYKGAGLAGMAEILAAALTGGGLDHELLPMEGPDFETPRGLGAFVIAIDPDAFVGASALAVTMSAYLKALRTSPAIEGASVMAPGDREWAEARRRRAEGVPVDTETASAFENLAETFSLELPFID